MKLTKKEAIADAGKYLHRVGDEIYCRRCLLLEGESEADFEEVNHRPALTGETAALEEFSVSPTTAGNH